MSPSAPRAATLRVDRFVVESELLRGNPLGDPTAREVIVLVPPGGDDAGRPLPLLCLLAGFAGSGATFLNRACFEEALDQRVARLFAEGCPPAFIVLPDCATRLGGSQYVNSTATGRYADHVLHEVLPAVERRHPVRRDPGGRALLGKSSGGFGALHLAFEHPGAFAAVACHSGDLGFELSLTADFPVAANVLARHGGVEPFLRHFFAEPKHASDAFTTISVLALAAAWSPSVEAPGGFDLPFDLATCELRADVFARWLAFDPVRRVLREPEALRGLALLLVDCGTRDEHHLHFGARRFARACRAAGVAVDHEEFDDGHRGTAYRYDRSIPRVVRALERNDRSSPGADR